MPNDNLVTLIKKASLEAFRASKPCNAVIGKVKAVSPLRIAVGQKMELSEDFLMVTKTARRQMTTGSCVLMIRQAGGQRFAVIDVLE